MEKKYSDTSKEDALMLAEREGVKSASEKLGLKPRHIYDWRKAKRMDTGKAPRGLKPGETADDCIKQLERECDELREADYILKKAMGSWQYEPYPRPS